MVTEAQKILGLALYSGVGLVAMSALMGVSFGAGIVLAGIAASVFVFVSLSALRRHFGATEDGLASAPSRRTTWLAGLGLVVGLVVSLTWLWSDAGETADQKDAARRLIEGLDQARAASDVEFLVDTLHPVTFDYWSLEDCRRALSRFLGERLVESVDGADSIGDGEIDYGQGRVGGYEDGYAVRYRNVAGAEVTARVAFVDDEPRWFTNCDQAGL